MSIISTLLGKGLYSTWLFIFLVFLQLLSSQAMAEKWYFEPVINMKLGYNDNTQLNTDNKIETLTSDITADAVFGFRTEVSDVGFTARMVDQRFDNHAYLNTNDQYLSLKSSIRSGLNLFGLDADYEKESTRTSEFDFSGFSTSEGNRITKSITPYWDRSLTERTSVRIDGAYSEVTYEDAGSSDLSDYTDKSVDMTLNYLLSERTTLQVVASKSLYKSDSAEYDSTSMQLGLNYMYSETFNMNLLLGPNYVESKTTGTGGEEKTSNVGSVIDLGFEKKFELTTLSGSLNSSESAGGEGKLIKKTKLSFSLQRRISDRTSFSLSGSLQQNESGGGGSDDADDREYFSIEPKLSWKATPWWTITGSYRYRQSENTASDEGAAKSNAVYINVEYVWPKESLSRWMDL